MIQNIECNLYVQIKKPYIKCGASNCLRSNQDRWAKAGPPPHGVTPVKGSVHVVVQRRFVDHVLHDARIADLLNWTRQVAVPDETFFSTLNHNPALGVPGAYKGRVYILGACISGTKVSVFVYVKLIKRKKMRVNLSTYLSRAVKIMNPQHFPSENDFT